MYSQILSSVQSSRGWIRTWVPGAQSVLYWFQNSGGCSAMSQVCWRVRGEKYRSFDRLPSSSARAPTITPVYGSGIRIRLVRSGSCD